MIFQEEKCAHYDKIREYSIVKIENVITGSVIVANCKMNWTTTSDIMKDEEK